MSDNAIVERPLGEASLGGGRLASVFIKWVEDDNPDLSHIGEWTDSLVPGAIEAKSTNGNEYKYFVSANHAVHNPKNWSHVPGEEQQKTIRKHGSLKNADHFYAREDMKRMEGYCAGEWRMTGCVVSGTYGALSADDSIWGIESDCGEKYRKTIERDCIENVVSELRKKLKGAKTA